MVYLFLSNHAVSQIHIFLLFFQQVWPIFARGGDYGPRYDMLEDGEIDESDDDEENDFEKRSAAEIFVDALTKKGWYFMLNKISVFMIGDIIFNKSYC